jgi:hypothetical protein
MKNGFGTMVWEDSRKYNGLWKNDLFDGLGTFYTS